MNLKQQLVAIENLTSLEEQKHRLHLLRDTLQNENFINKVQRLEYYLVATKTNPSIIIPKDIYHFINRLMFFERSNLYLRVHDNSIPMFFGKSNLFMQYKLADNVDNGYYALHPYKNVMVKVLNMTTPYVFHFKQKLKPLTLINHFKIKQSIRFPYEIEAKPFNNTLIPRKNNLFFNKWSLENTLMLLKRYTPKHYTFGYNLNDELVLMNKFLTVILFHQNSE